MRRILIAIAAALGIMAAPAAQAANSTISAMTAASAFGGTELMYIVQGGADRKGTPNQMQTYICGTGAGCVQASAALTTGNLVIGNGTNQSKDSLTYGTNGGISLSGGGTPSFGSCYWNDINTCTTENIRGRERVFFGNAVNLTDSSATCCSSANIWVGSTPSNVTYLMRDPQVVVSSDFGIEAISGLTRVSDQTGTARSAIGVSGYAWNNAPASGTATSAWGGYFQCDYQPVATSAQCYGTEIDAFNYSTNTSGDPYGQGFGAFSLWLAAGGTNPPAAAIAVNNNAQTFNKGIVFAQNALTQDSGGNAIALAMASGVGLEWYTNAATPAGIITSNAAGTIRFGALDAAAPVAQNLATQNVLTGTSNTAGQSFTIKGSAGTGTGAGGNILFQVAPTGTSGSTQNAEVTALEILGSQSAPIVQIGSTGVVTTVNNGNTTSRLAMKQANAGNNNTSESILNYGGASATGPASIILGFSRGASVNTNTTVAAGDDLGAIYGDGNDGTSFRDSTAILSQAEGTISTGIVPGRIVFDTANSSGTLTEAFRVTSSQQLQYTAAATGTAATAACFDSSNNLIKSSASSDCFAGGGGVSSITPGAALVSSTTSGSSQSAITSTGTLYGAEIVNAQTSTTYAIQDSDRGKLVTYTSASNGAWTIAQAGASTTFQTAWYSRIQNKGSGALVITPTTSTICGGSTVTIYPGQTQKITSDGTNYQCDGGTTGTVTPSSQTGSNYPFVSSNFGQLINLSNASAQTPTLPQAGTAGFATGWFVDVCNQGAGIQTITPTTSTIGGASTYLLLAGSAAHPVCVGIISDGTNYQLAPYSPTIASGTAALGTTLISAGACGSATTVSAPGVATTDVITTSFNGDPTATTGYTPSAMLTIVPYPTSGNANFKQCNLTGSSITPSALTLNWRVAR